MKFDLVRLNNNIDKSINIELNYSFSLEELKNSDILKLDNVSIKGKFTKNCTGNVELNCTVNGVMVLPCAVTLKPVDYPFSINISGELEELMQEIGENETNFQNTIDIFPIIWENILMEIPMRVVSPDAYSDKSKTEGDGWKFVTEDEKSPSPLSELMDILDDSEVR